MKKFISISLILIGVALIATVVVWYLLQGLFMEKAPATSETRTTDFIEGRMSTSETESTDTNTEVTETSGGLNLTKEQRQAAESVGIDPDAIVISDEMIDCAKDKLSDTRIDEILAGDAPTVIETLSLLPCMKN